MCALSRTLPIWRLPRGRREPSRTEERRLLRVVTLVRSHPALLVG